MQEYKRNLVIVVYVGKKEKSKIFHVSDLANYLLIEILKCKQHNSSVKPKGIGETYRKDNN